MLIANSFSDALLSADLVTALRCPMGAIGLLSLFLGFMGIIFFRRESAKIKLFVYLLLIVGVAMLTIELGKPSGSPLISVPAYEVKPPPSK